MTAGVVALRILMLVSAGAFFASSVAALEKWPRTLGWVIFVIVNLFGTTVLVIEALKPSVVIIDKSQAAHQDDEGTDEEA